MTKRCLFEALVRLANDLQAEGERLRFSPHKLALEAIAERLDVLLDTVRDEGIHEPEDETHGA